MVKIDWRPIAECETAQPVLVLLPRVRTMPIRSRVGQKTAKGWRVGGHRAEPTHYAANIDLSQDTPDA